MGFQVSLLCYYRWAQLVLVRQTSWYCSLLAAAQSSVLATDDGQTDDGQDIADDNVTKLQRSEVWLEIDTTCPNIFTNCQSFSQEV